MATLQPPFTPSVNRSLKSITVFWKMHNKTACCLQKPNSNKKRKQTCVSLLLQKIKQRTITMSAFVWWNKCIHAQSSTHHPHPFIQSRNHNPPIKFYKFYCSSRKACVIWCLKKTQIHPENQYAWKKLMVLLLLNLMLWAVMIMMMVDDCFLTTIIMSFILPCFVASNMQRYLTYHFMVVMGEMGVAVS